MPVIIFFLQEYNNKVVVVAEETKKNPLLTQHTSDAIHKVLSGKTREDISCLPSLVLPQIVFVIETLILTQS